MICRARACMTLIMSWCRLRKAGQATARKRLCMMWRDRCARRPTSWRGSASLASRQETFCCFATPGAYAMSMSSNYNSRPRAAEVLVSGQEYKLIRRRETLEDMLSSEEQG